MANPARSAFTLIEMMLVVAILGIVAALATSSYLAYIERARVARAVVEIHGIGRDIESSVEDGGAFPASLAEVGHGGRRDPWGNPYHYLRIVMGGPPAASAGDELPQVAAGPGQPPPGPDPDKPTLGQARKDRFLNPINSDFDLYSSGPDGESRPPLAAPVSRDDVIRGGDGSYVGLATGF